MILTGQFKMVWMVCMSYSFVFKKCLKLAHEQTLILVVFFVSDIIPDRKLMKKKWFESNQTWVTVSAVKVDSRTERILAIACLGKKLVFRTEICD